MDQLSFETLISTRQLARYMSMLRQYRRVVVTGPSGTGKTYLALALANFLLRRYDIDLALTCSQQSFSHCDRNIVILQRFFLCQSTC